MPRSACPIQHQMDNKTRLLVKISDFLALEGKFNIHARDAQQLNHNLSRISANDVPNEKVSHVLDYLIAALNVESVDPNIKVQIEKLTSDLQAIR